jgi:integrase
MVLTKIIVERAKAPTAGQTFIRDDETTGLALRITAGGVKSFIFEGRVRGRVRRLTLGQWPAMTVAGARDAVLKIRRAMLDGLDPADARLDARHEPTFGDLVDAYLADAEARGRRSLPRMVERIGKYLAPWRNRRASDITPGDVALLHQAIGRERGHAVANRVIIIMLRAIFNYALKLKLWKGENPATGLEPFPESARERFLTPAELERVNSELAAESHPYWRAYFSATLMLGTRKNELLGAKWADVDIEARTLRLPMTKNGRSHLLPIPEAVLRMLMELPSFARRDQGEGWVFPSTLAGAGHLADPSKAWQRIRERAGCPDVTIHDLRRSLGSWLASEGHSLLLIGRALGHKSSASTQIYARLALAPLREALERNATLMLGTRP